MHYLYENVKLKDHEVKKYPDDSFECCDKFLEKFNSVLNNT